MPATALAVLAGLVLLGRAASPPWNPPSTPPELRYPPLPTAAPVVEPPAGGFKREDATVDVPGERLAAAVFAPDRSGRHPAVVFVHGGGASNRDAFADQAEHLARRGIVALVYDKRTVGYSPLRRDYGQLAEDARAAAGMLRSRADVDPGRVGLWGTSEGGWVVPLAAAADPGIAFVILMNAASMSPLQQSSWALDGGLRRLGLPAGIRDAAIRAFGMGGTGYVHHDPDPALRAVRQPALILQGTADWAIPPVESPRRLSEALSSGGNTVRFFGDADHGMRVDGRLAPGYLATITTWVHGLPDLPQPRVAGPAPEQEFLSAAAPSPRYAGRAAHVVAFALIAIGFLAAPAVSLLGRLGTLGRLGRRGRIGTLGPLGRVDRLSGGGRVLDEPGRQVRRRLRWLVAGGAGTVLALNVALATAIALAAAGATSALPAVLAWYLARLMAAVTTVMLVAAAFAVAARLRQGWRPRGVERVRVYGVLGGTSIVLLLAAHWLA